MKIRKKVCDINILRKFLKAFINILILLEIILIALFLLPNLLDMKTYIVTSGSMEPLYPTGSLIYVKKANAKEVKEGDVITFYMEGSTVIATHQVYKIDAENSQFLTQGINNKDENGKIIHDGSPVKYTSLIGKPIFCIKYLGYINKFVTTPPGIYVIFAFTIFIIFINLILEKNKKMEGKHEKNKKEK